MDSYIVRIYLRRPGGATPSTGVVEVVASGEKLAFHDRDELWQILVAKAGEPERLEASPSGATRGHPKAR